MLNATSKVVVVVLVVTMAFFILSSGPEINSGKEVHLTKLDIEALIRALDMPEANEVDRKGRSPETANDEVLNNKIRKKRKKTKKRKKHQKSFPEDLDGASKTNGSPFFTNIHEIEQPDDSNATLQNDAADRRFKLRFEVLNMKDKYNPKRQDRRKIVPKLQRDDWWPTILELSYGKFFADFNLTSYTDEDAAYLRERLPFYEGRARRVSEVCSQYPRLRREKVFINTLVFDTLHTPNLVWCQLPKIASTSWNTNFLKLGQADDESVTTPSQSDEDEDHRLHEKVFQLFRTPNTTEKRYQVFSSALRFMIVRHPFVRLLSAYRSKMSTEKPKPVRFHYERVQKFIIDRYRPTDSSEDSPHPTFAEFVHFVLDQTEGLETPREWNKAVFGCWKPYYVSCGVCVHDMQMILKIETLDEDTEFLSTLAGLTQLKKERAWENLINNTSSGDVANDFFAQLTKSLVEELYDRYRIDFDMFGYSPQRYIDLALDD